MISLKLPKKKSEDDSPMVDGNGSDYPYGTRITLEDESLGKIPALQDVSDGDPVMLTAKGKVVMVSSEEHNGKKSRRVEIQIEEIDVTDKKSFGEGFNPTT